VQSLSLSRADGSRKIVAPFFTDQTFGSSCDTHTKKGALKGTLFCA